jgi:hypothetical protein
VIGGRTNSDDATSAGQVPSWAEAEVGPSVEGQVEAESRRRLRHTPCRTDPVSHPNRSRERPMGNRANGLAWV